jgi:DNA-binding CsgD family transcriptional regulator
VKPRTLQEEILAGDALTDREVEVLERGACGDTAAETGKVLFLDSETVRGYRKRIIAKLQARNFLHAVVLSVGSGVVNIDAVMEDQEKRLAS